MKRAAACLGVGLVLLACSSFVSVPTAVSPIGDASVDGPETSTSTPDDAMADAPGESPTGFCRLASSTLCADFDTATSFGAWGSTLVGEASLGTIDRDDRSGNAHTAGLRVKVLAGQTPTGVSYALRAPSSDRVFLEADVRIAAPAPFDYELTVLAIHRGDDNGTRVEATIGRGADGEDYLLRLHAKAGTANEQGGLVTRIGYGQWVRLRLESDLVGTADEGHARLKVLTSSSVMPGDDVFRRVTPSDSVDVSVVGLTRSDAANAGPVEADIDNVVGGAF